MNCPECNSENKTKCGYQWRKRKKVRRWRCGDCGRIFTDKEVVISQQKEVI